MSVFEVSQETPLAPEQAWERVTTWENHGQHVPLTRIRVVTPPPNGVGTVFVARTAVGRVGFDDPMEVVTWQPPEAGGPGYCRIEKRGRVMLGWAELSVQPRSSGSLVTWRERAVPARLPRFAHRAAALAGRLLFGRVMRGLLRDRPTP